MTMITLRLLAALGTVLVVGCSATIPPPVDVRGSGPVIIEPDAAPVGTVVVKRPQ